MTKIFIILFIFISPVFLLSQINNNEAQLLLLQNRDKIEQIKATLKAKGIAEDELNARLKSKGYDLQNLTPDQAANLESVVNETITELENENAAKKSKTPTNQDKKTVATDTEPQKSAPTIIINPQADNKGETGKKDNQGKNPNPKVAIYGQQIFIEGNPAVFTSSENINPANDYLVGTGDVIRIVIFGRSLYDGNLEVDDQGYIDPQTLPKIYVKGVEWGKVKKLIESRYKQRYSFTAGQIAVTIKKMRNVTVSVFGEVANPGTYTYPAANSAFNLIALAKGITDLGSVRNIKIVSPGGKVRTYDVYKSMMDPSRAPNIYLQDNDFIQVPVAQKVVSIKGMINRPYRYELLPNEKLKDLIQYAGGLKAEANKDNIQVIRFENDARNIYTLKLSEADKFTLKNGDEINITASSDEIKNMITITGEVEHDGEYQWRQGMRISDLLKLAGLKRTSRTDNAYIMSLNPDNSYSFRRFSPDSVLHFPDFAGNLLLKPNDQVTILSLPAYADSYKVQVSGAVRTPGEFNYSSNKKMKVSDLILMAGGLRPDALPKAYVIRTDTTTKITNYVMFDVSKALSNIDSADNFTVEPKDQVTILSNDILLNESTVNVNGSVKNPGEFKYGPSMTLMDAITLSGGFTTEAATNRIEVFRVIMNNNEPTKTIAANFELPRDLVMAQETMNKVFLEPYDIIVVRSVPKFKLQRIVTIEGEVKFPGQYALVSTNETITDLINRAGGLNPEAFTKGATLNRSYKNTGLVIIRLAEIMRNPKSSFNISLLEGDVLTIPRANELVSIEGAVNTHDILAENDLTNNRINVAFMEGKSVRYYVNNFAGGFSNHADKSKIFVQNANGERAKTKKFLFFKKYPKVTKGSAIVVGFKDPKKERTEPKEKADWVKILGDSIAQATAILTLVVLINTINKS
ncbi:MAG: SLBB domain-containing protein [Saprospiraceae bacterium]|nr:SLBB domain-containing protein [Saprospiraceae bacterium]